MFLTWIKGGRGDNRKQGETGGVRELFKQIQSNEARLVGSVMIDTEVLQGQFTSDQKILFSDVLARRNVQIVAIDRKISRPASEIRDYYRGLKNGLPTIETPDAQHLATAIIYAVDIFYTFDETDRKAKKRALIPLSGKIAGKHHLIIEKPMAPQGDLFERRQRTSG